MQTITTMTDEEWTKFPKYDDSGYGSVQSSEGNFPLKGMKIKSTIVGLSATTQIVQAFRNHFTKALEATYIFPLPPGGALRNFRIKVGDREIIGKLKERGEAREEYEQAISDGHRASIVEEERPDIFTIRVGNIEPGEEIEIRFDLVELLPVVDNEITYRFPLVVAQKYIPGNPLPGESVGDGVAWDTDSVPDASRISPPVLLPGHRSPVALSIEVILDDAGLGMSNLRSSLHTLKNEMGDKGRIEIVAGERLDRDFILRFNVESGKMKTQLLLAPDEVGEEGTFALTLIPSALSQQASRDVIFILDRSGSMGGWKMVAARRAVGRMIDSLKDDDRFSVLAFDTITEFFGTENMLNQATNRNRFRAVEWLSKIESRGGTEIMGPMLTALTMVSDADQSRDKTVVLVTDGQVGNENEIIEAVGARTGNTRIHTIGIDEAVSVAFLQGLAGVGRGVCELVESEDRLDAAMDRIHRNIGRASLTNIELSFEGMTVQKESLPSRIPDAYEGVATVILGRFSDANSPRISIKGEGPDNEILRMDLLGKMVNSPGLSATWARRHLRDLDDKWSINKVASLEEKIIETSIRFGILSRFTAFVAVDSSTKIETQQKVKVVQPVEAPRGFGQASTGRPIHPGAKGMMKRRLSEPAPPRMEARMAPMAPAAPTPLSVGSVVQSEMADDQFDAEMVFEVSDMEAHDEKIQWLGALLFEAISGQPFPADIALKESELGDWFDFLSELFDGAFASLEVFVNAMKLVGGFNDKVGKKTMSLQGLFAGDNRDLKLSAILKVAADRSFAEQSHDLNREKVWVNASQVFYKDPGKSKPFWKR